MDTIGKDTQGTTSFRVDGQNWEEIARQARKYIQSLFNNEWPPDLRVKFEIVPFVLIHQNPARPILWTADVELIFAMKVTE